MYAYSDVDSGMEVEVYLDYDRIRNRSADHESRCRCSGISSVGLNRHSVPIVTGCADFGARHRK